MNPSANNHGKPGGKKFIPGIAWFFFVLVLLCLPGSDIPSVDDWMNKIFFDKWVHTGLFSIMAFLFMFPFIKSSLPAKEKWHYLIKIAIATSIWGITSEVLQKYFIPGRSFDLFDWAADSLGALIAFLYGRFLLLKQRKGPNSL